MTGTVADVRRLGNGLINDTYLVLTAEPDAPDYVLQRINTSVFADVNALQRNISVVTSHIRRKLEAGGYDDVDRRVLTFVPDRLTGNTWLRDGDGCWRLSVYIPQTVTLEAVTPDTSYNAGRAFGQFQAMLVDVGEPLYETIPDFHNMEFRLAQLRSAVDIDPVGRVAEVLDLLSEIDSRAESMCEPERMHRAGLLPKRVCHCDTKVNNILFDTDGRVLCVIDLDTVMPSFVFSDYGDFLRTGACTTAEDEPDLSRIAFDMDIFEAFTRGYLSVAGDFLVKAEIDWLPMSVAMFPYMQAVRFLTDYINGDTYYKINYPEHNLVRTRAQLRYLHCVESHLPALRRYIHSLCATLR